MPAWVGTFLPVCRNTSALSKALPLDWAYGTERAYRNCKAAPVCGDGEETGIKDYKSF